MRIEQGQVASFTEMPGPLLVAMFPLDKNRLLLWFRARESKDAVLRVQYPCSILFPHRQLFKFFVDNERQLTATAMESD